MSGAAFLRLKKLKGGGIIGVAARHNRREIHAELGASGSIDPTRSHLNESLHGPATADAVAQLAKDLMAAAGVPTKRRKDAVMGLELVFSLPPNHTLDDTAYFTSCLAWVAEKFGGIGNVLSADVHRDEAAPHCHVLLLPLVNGRMAGSDLMGGPAKLAATMTDFHTKVAARYGLRRGATRLQGASRHGAAASVLDRLKSASDPILKSAVWATVRDQIERDPVPWLAALGIDHQAPAKKLQTMAQIFTGKGAGPARETTLKGFQDEQPFKGLTTMKNKTLQGLQALKKMEPFLCEGFAQTSDLNSPANPPTDRHEIGRQAIQKAMDRTDGLRHVEYTQQGMNPAYLTDHFFTKEHHASKLKTRSQNHGRNRAIRATVPTDATRPGGKHTDTRKAGRATGGIHPGMVRRRAPQATARKDCRGASKSGCHSTASHHGDIHPEAVGTARKPQAKECAGAACDRPTAQQKWQG